MYMASGKCIKKGIKDIFLPQLRLFSSRSFEQYCDGNGLSIHLFWPIDDCLHSQGVAGAHLLTVWPHIADFV